MPLTLDYWSYVEHKMDSLSEAAFYREISGVERHVCRYSCDKTSDRSPCYTSDSTPGSRPHSVRTLSTTAHLLELGVDRFLLLSSDPESSERQVERPLHLSAIPK
jgi:hypothetical protein